MMVQQRGLDCLLLCGRHGKNSGERGYHVLRNGILRKRKGGAGYLFLSCYLASPLAHHQSNTGKLVPLKGVAHAINLAVDDV